MPKSPGAGEKGLYESEMIRKGSTGEGDDVSESALDEGVEMFVGLVSDRFDDLSVRQSA